MQNTDLKNESTEHCFCVFRHIYEVRRNDESGSANIPYWFARNSKARFKDTMNHLIFVTVRNKKQNDEC